MAELAVAAMVASGAASTGATGVLFASTTAAAVASALPSAMTVLGALGTAASIFGSISGGNQQASIAEQNSKNEAAQLNLEQAAAEKDASERALDNVKQLRQTIARNNAYYAASGADISSGTPAAIEDANMEEADRQLRIDRQATDLAVAGYKSKAASVLATGSAAASQYRSAGNWKAAGTLFDSVSRYANRGSA